MQSSLRVVRNPTIPKIFSRRFFIAKIYGVLVVINLYTILRGSFPWLTQIILSIVVSSVRGAIALVSSRVVCLTGTRVVC